MAGRWGHGGWRLNTGTCCGSASATAHYLSRTRYAATMGQYRGIKGAGGLSVRPYFSFFLITQIRFTTGLPPKIHRLSFQYESPPLICESYTSMFTSAPPPFKKACIRYC